ncbi:transposase [Photorhabdus asymbiotica]
MKLQQPRRQYSAEFKLEVVQQVVLHQQQIVDVARSLSINTGTLGKWVYQYQAEKQGVTLSGKAFTSEQRRIQEQEKYVRQ